MLTGKRPKQDLVAPSKKVELDVRIDEIVLRALEKGPSKRHQGAGEFRTVVETMAEAGPPPVNPPAAPEVPKRKSKAPYVFAGIGCLLMILIVPVLMAIWLWLAHDSNQTDELRRATRHIERGDPGREGGRAEGVGIGSVEGGKSAGREFLRAAGRRGCGVAHF